jgi:hypothetical protein
MAQGPISKKLEISALNKKSLKKRLATSEGLVF